MYLQLWQFINVTGLFQSIIDIEIDADKVEVDFNGQISVLASI